MPGPIPRVDPGTDAWRSSTFVEPDVTRLAHVRISQAHLRDSPGPRAHFRLHLVPGAVLRVRRVPAAGNANRAADCDRRDRRLLAPVPSGEAAAGLPRERPVARRR